MKRAFYRWICSNREICMKIDNEQVVAALHDYVYLCAASYEARAVTAAEYLMAIAKPLGSYVFHAVDCCEQINGAVEILSKILPNCELVETRLNDPTFSARNIVNTVERVCGLGKRDVLIDITTFTHEQLLVLMRVLLLKKAELGRVCCVYTHSREYSYGAEGEAKWLSRGCKEIRSVIGFPGMMVPGNSMTLVVLSGFEFERATEVIAEMEPDRLVIGTGLAQDGEASIHQQSMRKFQRLIRDFCSMRSNVSEFEFSSQDVDAAESTIGVVLQRAESENIVVVPMNTKLSTVALAKVVIKNPAVQICYAQPVFYNIDAYSLAGDRLSFVEL